MVLVLVLVIVFCFFSLCAFCFSSLFVLNVFTVVCLTDFFVIFWVLAASNNNVGLDKLVVSIGSPLFTNSVSRISYNIVLSLSMSLLRCGHEFSNVKANF